MKQPLKQPNNVIPFHHSSSQRIYQSTLQRPEKQTRKEQFKDSLNGTATLLVASYFGKRRLRACRATRLRNGGKNLKWQVLPAGGSCILERAHLIICDRPTIPEVFLLLRAVLYYKT